MSFRSAKSKYPAFRFERSRELVEGVPTPPGPAPEPEEPEEVATGYLAMGTTMDTLLFALSDETDINMGSTIFTP